MDTCRQAELPEPEMKELDGGFIITIFKNNITEDQLIKLGLSDRQLKAVLFVKEKGKISNTEFQVLFSVSKATATRDLTELVEKFELFEKVGQTGAGTFYLLKN